MHARGVFGKPSSVQDSLEARLTDGNTIGRNPGASHLTTNPGGSAKTPRSRYRCEDLAPTRWRLERHADCGFGGKTGASVSQELGDGLEDCLDRVAGKLA